MSANSFSVNSPESFSMDTEKNKLFYFNRNSPKPSLTLSRNKQSDVQIKILQWDNDNKKIKKWMVKSAAGSTITDYEIFLLKAGCNYSVSKNGIPFTVEKTDSNGTIHFSSVSDSEKEDIFELNSTE